MAALAIGFNACGNPSGAGFVETVEIDECTNYEAAFRTCAQRLGANAPGMIDQQVVAMRQGFTRAAKDDESRERLKQSCAESTRRMREACR